MFYIIYKQECKLIRSAHSRRTFASGAKTLGGHYSNARDFMNFPTGK